NIPWKTRGNAAVCLRIGSGRGRPMTVGELGGKPIQMFPRGRGDEPPTHVLGRVSRLVERWSRFDDETTNPGFTISPAPARAWLYWRAVRRIVTMDEAVAAASTSAIVRGYKKGRGIIGALAATSWRPRDRTYEVLCYREKSSWGTRRELVPRVLRGGHVVVCLSGVDVTAYEPSKQFRAVVAALWPGDRIGVIGAVREEPRTLNLEKLQVLDVVNRVVKIANPTCNSCGCRAKSMGRTGLFRCPKCREKFPRST